MDHGSPAKRAKRDDGFILGGHDDGVRLDGTFVGAANVLKKKQAGARGECEEQFLKLAICHPFLKRCVVRYLETRQEGGHSWLVLEVSIGAVPVPCRSRRMAADARAPPSLYLTYATGHKPKHYLNLVCCGRTSLPA